MSSGADVEVGELACRCQPKRGDPFDLRDPGPLVEGGDQQFKVYPCTFSDDLDHAPIREVARVAGDAQPTGFLDDECPVPDPLDTSVRYGFKPLRRRNGLRSDHAGNSSKHPCHLIIT